MLITNYFFIIQAENMEKIEFKVRARSHLKELISWFGVSLIGGFIFVYASKEIEGQADFTEALLYLLFCPFGFGILFFPALIYSWFSNYEGAQIASKRYTYNEMKKTGWDSVIGPIPWGF